MSRTTDIAWAAGLFEGEGCACIHTVRGNRGVHVSLTMTDGDVVARFRSVVGIGKIDRYEYPPRKTIFKWRLDRKADVTRTLRLLLPYLGIRRRTQVQTALQIAERPHAAKGRRRNLQGQFV